MASLNRTITDCRGKHAFDSFDQADAVAKRMRRRKDTRGGNRKPPAPYRCTICRQWHLGGEGR